MTATNVRPISHEQHRLRLTHAQDGAPDAWERLAPSIAALKKLVHAADREALKKGAISTATAAQVEASFADFETLLNVVLADSAQDAEESAQVGARVQCELLPYLLLSANAERWYSKPRGYAGDFLSIARMYDDAPAGAGRIGPLLDRCFLNLAAARAVRNRRPLLAREIEATIAACAGRAARVTSLACGPAAELFDVYAGLPDAGALHATLVDMDLHALAYVADRRDAGRLRASMSLVNENLVYLATGRRRITLEEQDLVYSVGLIDYFDDAFVIKLMNFAHAVLRPGGRVVLGNFHPQNPTRALLDHVLDWKLIHRTEEDMNRLFRASAFGRASTRVVFEEQEINLFAECVRSD